MEGQLKELSEKELAYCEAYFTTNFSKTKAAMISTGCKESSARAMGYEMYNRPHVKAYIQNYLKQNTLDGDETIKLVSRIAQSDIKDYYKPVEVLRVTKVKTPLSDLIDQLQMEIEIKEEFRAIKGLTETAYDDYQVQILDPLEDQVTLYQLELKRNPLATRVIDVEEMVTEQHLDMNLLVADKERGMVKKVKYGKDGLEVEMYAADASQDRLLKVHGKFEKDNERVVKITSNVSPEQAKEIAAALESKY